MPFVRFSRDKRGYEHVYLVQASHTRGDATPARILYWYRTPPGVKVGREPFDEAARRALESEYPNIVFDWKRIINAPMPPPEAENWRERRRVERAMRQARAAEESEEEAPGDEEEDGRAASPGENPQAPAAVPSPAVSTGSPHVAGADGQTRRRRRRGGGRRRKPAGPTLAAESVSAMETVSAAESASAVESVPAAESQSPDVHAADVLDPDEEE